MFFCPLCKKTIINFNKACCVKNREEIPVLIDGFSNLEEKIALLREQKQGWYQATHVNYLQGPFRYHIRDRLAYLKKIFKKFNFSYDSTMLDLGCGDGFNLSWLKDFSKNLYGTDYNLLRAVRARNLGIANIAVADINKYPCYDKFFDVVFFNHVLEHIPDEESALKEVFRILKIDGFCVLGVPNEGAFFWQLAYNLEPKIKKSTDHLHFYTLKSISKLCKNIGFKVVQTKRLGYGIPHWTIDSIIRQNKIIHVFLDVIGRLFFSSQATSLYLILQK